MKETVFTGAGVALVTPMNPDGSVNYNKLKELIEFQIANHTDAIVICGTTGEGSTLTHEEHMECIDFTCKTVAGRIPVIAGTGSNDTAYALELSKAAEVSGVDAFLMVTPYYNKTSQAGLIKHFTYLADRLTKPIILYNVPSRTGMTIKPETYVELAKHERIVATKEASGDISAVLKIKALCGDNLDIYSGNDDQIAPIMACGGKGVISVLSNILPRETHEMAMKGLNGDIKGCLDMQLKYLDLCNDLFVDVNPIPVKEAMNLMNFNVGSCRMPLAEMSDSDKAFLIKALKNHALV